MYWTYFLSKSFGYVPSFLIKPALNQRKCSLQNELRSDFFLQLCATQAAGPSTFADSDFPFAFSIISSKEDMSIFGRRSGELDGRGGNSQFETRFAVLSRFVKSTEPKAEKAMPLKWGRLKRPMENSPCGIKAALS